MPTIRIVEDGFIYTAAEQSPPEYRYLPGICPESDSHHPDKRDMSLWCTVLALMVAMSGMILFIVFVICLLGRLLRQLM